MSPAAQTMWRLAEDLFPLCRSLTGHGVRRTLERISEEVEIDRHEVPSGSSVLDWVVPPEWNAHSARLVDPDGRVLADLETHNLHLMGYSTPVRGRFSLETLESDGHLASDPTVPEAIPYRTSYYRRHWAFCLPHAVREALRDGIYDVTVDTTLDERGALSYGEVHVPGRTAEEVLFSAHVCHPSLANDNLSGIVIATALAAELAERTDLRYSYRFVFAPGAIGAITWLHRNRDTVGKIVAGLVLANLGDAGAFYYKRSRRGDTAADRAALSSLLDTGASPLVESFFPDGYDERQYGSPGFDLPIGSLSRSKWGHFPEYHSSDDDLELVRPWHLEGSLDVVRGFVDRLEGEDDSLSRTSWEPGEETRRPAGAGARYRSRRPWGEPQLGRYGVFDWIGSSADRRAAVFWVLNLADGLHSLGDVAERSRLARPLLEEAARLLVDKNLLEVP